MTDDVLAVRATIQGECVASFPALLRKRATLTPDDTAYIIPMDGDYREVSWSHVQIDADEVSAGLVSLGLEPGQRVAIDCSTRYRWILADLGIAGAGAVTTTIYPNSHAEDVAYILRDCEATMVVAENHDQLEKIRATDGLMDQICAVILVDDDRPAGDDDDKIIAWETMVKRGQDLLERDPGCVDERIAELTKDTLSTIIYTSGTTGTPKGVELVHENWIYEGAATTHLELVRPGDLLYLWLPLAHVFGRDLVTCAMSLNLPSVVDGRVDRILDGMAATNPTVLVGVPRIFEKIRATVLTMYPQSGIKGRLVNWSFRVGHELRRLEREGTRRPLWLRLRYAIADRLVFSQLRAKLGSRMRFMISGSAKLSREVQEWFSAAGLTIVEGYGATETTAIAFVNEPGGQRIGTVGKALPGLQVKIADDGEICLKGPTIARRYHGLPDKTDEAFVDGWYRTGDSGRLDADGFLTITDRKKDLFKTSNGKFVAPQKIENLLTTIPYISQAIAIGDDRKFVTAIIEMDSALLEQWARRRGNTDLSYAELSQLPEIRKSIDRNVRRLNSKLERWEQIKRYIILDHELSEDRGLLTASLKVRRTMVYEQFADEIDGMYEDQARSDLVP